MKYVHDLSLRLGIALFLLLIPYDIFYYLFLDLTKNISAYFLNAATTPTSILIPGYELVLIPACIASIAYLLLALLLLTTAGISWKNRILIMLIGSAAIFLANTLRIIILAQLIQTNYAAYQTWHLVTWNVLSTLFVVILWIVLIKAFKIKTIPVITDFTLLRKHLQKAT